MCFVRFALLALGRVRANLPYYCENIKSLVQKMIDNFRGSRANPPKHIKTLLHSRFIPSMHFSSSMVRKFLMTLLIF